MDWQVGLLIFTLAFVIVAFIFNITNKRPADSKRAKIVFFVIMTMIFIIIWMLTI